MRQIVGRLPSAVLPRLANRSRSLNHARRGRVTHRQERDDHRKRTDLTFPTGLTMEPLDAVRHRPLLNPRLSPQLYQRAIRLVLRMFHVRFYLGTDIGAIAVSTGVEAINRTRALLNTP